MTNWLYLLKIILIISIPLFLVLLNLYPLTTQNFAKFNYNLLDFENKEERLTLASEVIGFVKDTSNAKQLDGRVFTEREIMHLSDVKNLVLYGFRIHFLSAILLIVSTLLLINEKTPISKIKNCYYTGLSITLGFMLLLGLYELFDFNLIFVKFHQLLFSGDSWLFSPSNTLIKLFPLNFWVNTAKIVLTLTIIELFLVFLLVYKAEAVKEKFNKSFGQLIKRL